MIISSMYPPENTGGVATHVNYLVRALLAAKTTGRHFIHVVAASGDETRLVSKGGKPPNFNMHWVSGIGPHFDSSGSVPYEKAIRKCMKLCNDPNTRPDVIHVHDFEGIHIASLLKAVYDIPLVLTIHKTPKEWDSTTVFHDPKNFHLHAVNKLDIFDHFVAPSLAYQQHLLDQGIGEEKIEVIHHAIPRYFLQSHSDLTVFDRISIDRDKPIVFCPIRLDKHKGPDVFIEAVAHVLESQKNDELQFVIAGNGSHAYTQSLRRIAEANGVAGRVVIGPPDGKALSISEMASMYRQAQICVLPSRREGFGLAILEAFIFGVPIVGSNVGGIGEVIRPEYNGLLFNRDEADHLAHQILRLLGDKRLGKQLVENAKKDVEGKYGAEEMAEKYYRLYMKCKNRKKTM